MATTMMMTMITTKTKTVNDTHQRRQTGFTLVEMMIAIVISMVLMAGIVSVLQSNRLTYRTIEGNSIVQELGRISVQLLKQQLRMIAFRNDPRATETNAFDNIPTGLVGIASAAVSGLDNNSINSSDQISLRYYGTQDCVGNILGGGSGTVIAGVSALPLATNTFNIQLGANGRPALFCNNTELLEGIDTLQVQYGVDTTGDGSANQFVVASVAVNMNRVVALKFGLLASTNTQYAAYQDTTSHNVLGAVVSAQNDRRVRRVYTATVNLRNRCATSTTFDC